MRKSRKVVLGLTIMSMVMGMAAPAGVCVIPGTVQTVSAAVTAQGRCGDNAEYQYDDETQTLTVKGSGAMWDDYGFAKSLKDTKNIVIEKGITTVGSYSFYDLENVESVSIGDTVTAIKEYAFRGINGTVEIPASVTKVESNAFGGVSKMIIRGDVKGYEKEAFRAWSRIGEVILYGTAQDFAKALYRSVVKTVTIANENKACKVSGGCLVSSDGKELYYCLNSRNKVTIPATVETISTAAFLGRSMDQLILGSNVKSIGDFAFYDSTIGEVVFNKKLETIGVKAFCFSGLKKVSFRGKVKMNVAAFDHATKIGNDKGFRYSQTTVDTANVKKSKYAIKFAKVSGANGYEIKVQKGKKTYKYTTKKTSYTKKAPKILTKNYSAAKEYTMTENEYLKNVKGAATVTVRPYQIVRKKKKSKKTYGMWSEKMVISKK